MPEENIPTRWQRRTWQRAALALVAVLALAPATLLAVDTYNDVTVAHPFYADIEAITHAGITVGCGSSNPDGFCPNSPIARQAEAAFLHRGLSRVAWTETALDNSVISANDSSANHTQVAGLQLTVGGTTAKDPDATQYVKVDAVLSLTDGDGVVPYGIYFYLHHEGATQPVAGLTLARVESTTMVEQVSLTAVFPAAPGEHKFAIHGYINKELGEPGEATVVNVSMTATTHAFGQPPTQ